MNFLTSIISASTSALSNVGGIPGLPGYQLGEKVNSFEGKSLWTLYEGTKKDDSSSVSIFFFDSSNSSSHSSYDRRSLLPLAKNALRKIRTLRHPNILKFVDGVETDSSVWIVTEHVRSLALELSAPRGLSEESKVYGLLHIATALSFLNKDGQSIQGNVRLEALWITQGGEWKLGGMELCTKKDEDAGVIWSHGGSLPDSRTFASPEVRKGGWAVLKEYDASSLDSYQLHLLLYCLFNGPLPMTFSSSSDVPPALPSTRGSIPQSMFQAWRRLGNPNSRARLKTDVFLELGLGSESVGGGWWPSNRLVRLSVALEGFSLATESERAGLIRTLQEVDSNRKGSQALPEEFLKYKVLPSLVRAFEFGGGGPALLPLILGLAASLPEKEYITSIIQPLIRMFSTPDRAMRMALLDGLDKFSDKLTTKDVVERVWPHVLTGFSDVVPIIREATVKSVLLLAPKLNDRILNNDLLRHLAKTQTDSEPGIRTNTCILLGRLSRHLQPSTNRKVLVPAFARALRDPFVHARIAGLMALMATADCYEKEDLAGKVIPAMSICLVDPEKSVRDQGYKAIDMFVKKCESLTASMPDTIAVENGEPNSGALQAAALTQPGLATNAAGAAGALAGWAFASVSKKISPAELHAPIERQSPNPPAQLQLPHAAVSNSSVRSAGPSSVASSTSQSQLSIPGGFGESEVETEDWGGDLMDVNNDDDDWDEYTSGQQAPSRPSRVDPLLARLSATKAKPPARKAGAMKLGSSALRIPMDMDATDSWDLEETSTSAPIISKAPTKRAHAEPLSVGPKSSNSVSKALPKPASSTPRPAVAVSKRNSVALAMPSPPISSLNSSSSTEAHNHSIPQRQPPPPPSPISVSGLSLHEEAVSTPVIAIDEPDPANWGEFDTGSRMDRATPIKNDDERAEVSQISTPPATTTTEAAKAEVNGALEHTAPVTIPEPELSRAEKAAKAREERKARLAKMKDRR